MSNETALVIAEQREIEFYGDAVIAVRMVDNSVFVPVRPLCDLIGVRWNAQYERIQRDPILSTVSMSVRVTRTDIDPSSRTPRNSDMLALPLDYLNGWLFGIQANRVKSEIKDTLLQYQKDCYRVLADAFLYDRITARPDSEIEELIRSGSPAAIAYQNALAVANLARHQLLLEKRLNSAETRINAIEARLSDPDRLLTTDQARRVADAVQTVAHALGERSGRNEYGGVYNELYRRFEIPDYRSLPSAKFEDCMTWLRTWYGSLTGTETPF